MLILPRSFLLLQYTLFLYCLDVFVHHRPLPSSPTRRSSDLDAATILDRAAAEIVSHPELRAFDAIVHDDYQDATLGMRSEEHTSELQSRGHLVCRLLLEKKNKGEMRARVDRCKGTRPEDSIG